MDDKVLKEKKDVKSLNSKEVKSKLNTIKCQTNNDRHISAFLLTES